MVIGVIGSSTCNQATAELACEVGREIAKRGGILICGGLGGVMEAACKGAREKNGITIGILPGNKREDANSYVQIPIVTGLGIARNIIIVRSSDAIIAITGRYGTLSEIAFALQLEIPVIGLNTWKIKVPIIRTKNPKEAVELAYKNAKQTVTAQYSDPL
ncbi:MAG: TIGR00725 family protein [Candidatus Edwardsbacteria bacterium]